MFVFGYLRTSTSEQDVGRAKMHLRHLQTNMATVLLAGISMVLQ